jgi:3-deoxy-manno-octulosonate cytidylyltransferase (CMP-KDO synthetase)
MIAHVYARASESRLVDDVLVATDDPRIAEAVDAFGGTAVLTRADHPSGTDRLAEVAAHLSADIIVNLQGDEPMLDPASVDAAIAPLVADATIPMGTLRTPLAPADANNPNVVKVVVTLAGAGV